MSFVERDFHWSNTNPGKVLTSLDGMLRIRALKKVATDANAYFRILN